MGRVNKLTQEEISKEMSDVLDKLSRGEYVDIDIIDNLKEIKDAKPYINYSNPTSMLKGREALQGYLIEQLDKNIQAYNAHSNGQDRFEGFVSQDKRLDIVIGLPASGKSSAIVNDMSKQYHSKMLDNDEAKKVIPEYNHGWGAGIVHEESQQISDEVFLRALSRGDNIILPKVGSNADKLLSNHIKLAKNYGYEVNIHYVELDRNKALNRMLCRYLDTGRFIDPHIIDKYDNKVDGNKIEKAYEALKDNPDIHGYSKWSNNVPFGEKPILIEASGTLVKEAFFVEASKRCSERDNVQEKENDYTTEKDQEKDDYDIEFAER